MLLKNKNILSCLFNPKSVAIVGASEGKGKVGTAIAKNVLELGYAGEVFLVNPKHEKLYGRECYKNISDTGREIDVAIIVVPSKFVIDVMRDASGKVKNFVIISAGFSEIGEDGKKKEDEIAKFAKDNNLNILGPNCLGFIAPSSKLNASFAMGLPDKGNVSLISQSGALMVAFLDSAKKKNIGFSNVVSVGNKMHLDESALLEYLADDKNTDVVALYLEGIKDGKRFIETASKVSKRKPIIVLKAGRSEKAQKAISSHTGALAGSDEIMDAVFEKTGVIRANSIEQFFALILICSKKSWQKARGIGPVAVITNAGGPGVLTADAFEGKNIKIAEISKKTKDRLREFLPEEGSAENPIDLLGDAQEDRYKKALEILDKDDEIGSILAILTPQDNTPVSDIAEVISKYSHKGKKPVATSFIGGDKVSAGISYMRGSDIVHLAYPDSAVDVMDKYYSWKEGREEIVKAKAFKQDKDRMKKVFEIITEAKKEKRKALRFDEASRVMDMYGIRTVKTALIAPGKKLTEEISFPVVAKIDSDKVLHKTDQKALILDIKNTKEVDEAVSDLQERFSGEHVIVQEMLSKGSELILGIKRDPIFGPIVLCGIGGIYTEVFHMVEFFVSPLSEEETVKKLEGGKLGFLFKETRGQAPHDSLAVAKIIDSIMQLAIEAEEILEFDINPLFIYNDGKESIAVDVKIIF